MEKIVLIDGHSILNRAFFGLPDMTNHEGLHTNAVLGFLNIMTRILSEEKPQYLAVAFDLHAPTFRHKMFDGYKGTRKPMADELREQVPLIKEMLTAMQVPIITMEGFEADDILGTIARKSEERGLEVRIISGDRDLLQLATEHTCIRIPKTKMSQTIVEDYFAKDVKEAYGVTPEEFIDVKALQGDTSDNIPGIPGIGEKTARELIETYHSLENAYEHREEIKKKSVREHMTEYIEQGRMSKTLATIITDVELDFSFDDAILNNIYTQEAYALCRRLDFKKILSNFEGINVNNINTTKKESVKDDYKKLVTLSEFKELANKTDSKEIFLDIIGSQMEYLNGENGINGQIESVVLLLDEVEGASIKACENKQLSLFDFLNTENDIKNDDEEADEEILSSLINDIIKSASKIYTTDAKKLLKYLTKENVEYVREENKLFDVTVMAYLCNPLRGEYTYDYLAMEYLNETVPTEKEIERQDMYLLQSKIGYKVAPILLEQLKEQEGIDTYLEIEMPVLYVLDEMEKNGIIVNDAKLKEYGDSLSQRINELESSIIAEAGEEFNINSPKQLGTILFEKMQLPNGKKTKTGYSTSAEVLEKLAEDYPFVENILEYRTLSKLKSTYADGLRNFIRKEDGRIHGLFNQTITATGRLSSSEPNLQNIPIRMELGRLIRKVFIPKTGYSFLDADYSQIELRLLAHMSGDEALIRDFNEGKDIHRSTAAKVFHVDYDKVTDIQRRNAKAVNFGIVYGISAFGLGEDLKIPTHEAKEYIDAYFEVYPGIKAFLDNLVKDAKEKGYAKTLYGRRRPIPELSSSNFMQRSFGERVAMNAPIQGTAADIMKIAMISVFLRLKKEKLESRILVQVHDELLIETKNEEIEIVTRILNEEMEHAAKLLVEIPVDVHAGNDWYEAK